MESLQTLTPLTDFTSECETIDALIGCPAIFDRIRDSQESELRLQQTLRSEFPPDVVRAALTLCELRKKGKDKFSRAERMWFDRKGLEQATPEVVAVYKSQRFKNSPSAVLDLCSGIGSDSLAIANTGQDVVAVDLSIAASKRLTLNADVYGVKERIQTLNQDVRNVDVKEHWIHIDPDRRASGKRVIRLEDYEPPLEFMQSLTEASPAGAIKLSPASNFGGKFFDCEIELISLNGECKEATVWFGDAAGEYDWRATLLPSGATITGNPAEFYPEVGDLGLWIYDPDPAVVRAGLVDALTSQLQLQRLDDAEEYLTSATLIESPFVSAFEVQAELPNQLKEIKKYFREHPVGELEIKCRHVPTNADQLRKKIPLNGTGKATLIIARLQGKARAIVASRHASQ